MGKIECPLLLINAIDDQNWPTTEFAKHVSMHTDMLQNILSTKFNLLYYHLTFNLQMAQMIRAAGKEHLLTIVDYPDSGHLIEPPFSPHFRATKFIVNSSTEKGNLYQVINRQSFSSCHFISSINIDGVTSSTRQTMSQKLENLTTFGVRLFYLISA